MCEPVSIGLLAGAGTAGAGTAGALGTLTGLQTASLALSAGSTVVSAYGNYQQAAANKNTANYNASVTEMEAQDDASSRRRERRSGAAPERAACWRPACCIQRQGHRLQRWLGR